MAGVPRVADRETSVRRRDTVMNGVDRVSPPDERENGESPRDPTRPSPIADARSTADCTGCPLLMHLAVFAYFVLLITWGTGRHRDEARARRRGVRAAHPARLRDGRDMGATPA